MPPEDKEEKTGSFFQRNKLWIILGVVFVGLIIFFSVRGNQAPAEPAVTLQSVNTEVQSIKARVATEEGKSATQAEGVADILSDIAAIQEQIDGLEAPSAEIAIINATLAELENTVSNLIPYYVLVTRVEDDYVDVTTYKVGDYPIVVSLYGQNLTDVDARYPTVYHISGLWGSTTMFVVVVEPTTEWTLNYAVEFKITGVVEYATATIGRGQGQSEEGW